MGNVFGHSNHLNKDCRKTVWKDCIHNESSSLGAYCMGFWAQCLTELKLILHKKPFVCGICRTSHLMHAKWKPFNSEGCNKDFLKSKTKRTISGLKKTVVMIAMQCICVIIYDFFFFYSYVGD